MIGFTGTTTFDTEKPEEWRMEEVTEKIKGKTIDKVFIDPDCMWVTIVFTDRTKLCLGEKL